MKVVCGEFLRVLKRAVDKLGDARVGQEEDLMAKIDDVMSDLRWLVSDFESAPEVPSAGFGRWA